LKPIKTDLIKASSLAIGLVLVIAFFSNFVIPPYVFVSPGQAVYVSGIVDHKSIGHGYDGAEPKTWYTVSVRLFDDDPVNRIRSGETIAYIVPTENWEMIEWGDTVKIKLLPNVEAEVVELYPSLKLPEWHRLSDSASPISIELTADKTTYNAGEKANFTVHIRNAPEEKGWIGPSIPLNLTAFTIPPFWVFQDGKKGYSLRGDMATQQTILQPGEELNITFEWTVAGYNGLVLPKGAYYVRVYLGYFTENEETTLTGTTMIGID